MLSLHLAVETTHDFLMFGVVDAGDLQHGAVVTLLGALGRILTCAPLVNGRMLCR